MRNFILISSLFLFCCCNVKYYITPEGGYRLYDSTKFKFNKLEYKKMSKSAIDTNSIYIMDSSYSKWNDVKIKKNARNLL